MSSIGEKLRRKRVETGVSLDQVAAELRIGVRMLAAIEAEEFEKLPGGVFRKSFVLQYARTLGFDPEGIAAELKQLSSFDEAPNVPGQEVPRFGSDMPAITPRRDWSALRNSLGSLATVVVVILGCAGLYMWWQSNERARSALPAVNLAQEQAAPQTQPVSRAPAPAPDARELTSGPSSSAAVRVGLTAGEETWVQVLSDGKRVFSSALHANQTKIIEASEKVRLLVGNAGGIQIFLNGKPIGPIGPRGQVRVVELTHHGFQIVSRKPPTSEPL